MPQAWAGGAEATREKRRENWELKIENVELLNKSGRNANTPRFLLGKTLRRILDKVVPFPLACKAPILCEDAGSLSPLRKLLLQSAKAISRNRHPVEAFRRQPMSSGSRPCFPMR
jgi:hypothetical protein